MSPRPVDAGRSVRRISWMKRRAGLARRCFVAALITVSVLVSAQALAERPGPTAQITLDAAFDNGNLDGWSFDGTHYTVNSNNAAGQ